MGIRAAVGADYDQESGAIQPRSTLHKVEKFFVGLGGFQLVQHELDGLCFIHRVQQFS
jgi:hypothetical protein